MVVRTRWVPSRLVNRMVSTVGQSPSVFPGVKDKEAIEPDALLVAEPVGPEFVGRANLPRRAEVVDHDFVGGEDEAVGTVVGAPDRLVADGKTLTGFKIEEGELTGAGARSRKVAAAMVERTGEYMRFGILVQVSSRLGTSPSRTMSR